jgi:hypothetical protein
LLSIRISVLVFWLDSTFLPFVDPVEMCYNEANAILNKGIILHTAKGPKLVGLVYI